MNLFNLFGCKAQNDNDTYWKFDKSEHFRPKLNKGEFYKLSGFDFGWFVLEPISKFVKDKDHEIERGKSLSYGQKALYYWWYLDAQVTNGGFVQFYYNGYAKYVPTIIKGLEHIGDIEMTNLVKKADKIYQKNKKLMDKAQESDLFGSDLYDRLDEMSLLDDKYYEINVKTMSLIENYIRKNPNEIGIDEYGKEFDITYTGLCKTFYESKKIKYEFQLENGLIYGEFNSFFENGNLQEVIKYKNGVQTGERKEYYENGELKNEVIIVSSKKLSIHKSYYINGHPEKLETKRLNDNERFGEYKEWYENGQLSKAGTYKSAYERSGEWLEFYKDGSKKVEAEFVNGNFKLINHWNENGLQLLTEGTGLYVYEFSMFGDKIERNEQEYKNYQRHGKQKTYTNGILTLYQEMENGIEHGITRTYFDNGNLKQETLYQNGKSVSTENFQKFKNPRVKTNVLSRLCKDCYEEYEGYQLPDNDPMPINDVEIAEKFKVETSLFKDYGDDYILSYGYFLFVDEKGTVTEIKFAAADNMWLDEKVRTSMIELKFEPAIKNSKPLKSIHYVRYQLKLIESNQ